MLMQIRLLLHLILVYTVLNSINFFFMKMYLKKNYIHFLRDEVGDILEPLL